MKNLTKRGLSLLLVLIMCLGMLNITAFAAESELICGQTEHTHTDECYTETKTLNCGQAESEGHSHSDSCYSESTTLSCSSEEEGHEHGDGCYSVDRSMNCGQSESAGHTHDDGCYTTGNELTCGLAEHVHTDACYSTADDSQIPEDKTPNTGMFEIVSPAEESTNNDLQGEVGTNENVAAEANVPANVQAFLDAVAELPEEVTKENVEEVYVLWQACMDAMETLSEEEMGCEDVIAVIAKLTGLMEEITLLDEPEVDGVARVGDTGYETLQEAIREAGSEEVILLEDVTESILLPVGATLNLNGHILTGSGKVTINMMFLRVPGNVTIKNGTIVGAEGYRAIYASNVNLTLENVTINTSGSLANETVAKTATAFGGGCVYMDKGTLMVNNCTFSGDAGQWQQWMAAMGKYTVTDVYGSHIFLDTNATGTITNSTFTGSNSKFGAIYATGGSLTVSGSTFSNNANGLQLNGTGTFDIADVTFTSSTKAINVSGKANVTLTDCNINNNPGNMASGDLLNLGSANVTIKNGEISNNTTTGKVIYSSSGTLIIDGTKFSNNAVNSVVNTSSSNVTIKNVTATGNKSSLNMNCGGGVFMLSASGKTVTLENVTATGNEATSGDGGVAYITGNTSTVVNITDCTFTGNTAKLTGGALYLSNTGSTTITNTEISGNTSNSTGKVAGGGIYVANTSGTVTLAGTTRVYNNEAPEATVKHLTIAESADIALYSNRTTSKLTEATVKRATLVLNGETSFVLDGITYTLTKSEASGLNNYKSGSYYYWPVGYYTEKVEPAKIYLNGTHAGEKDICETALADAVAKAKENGVKTIYVCGNTTVDLASAASLNSGITFARCAEHGNGYMFTINGTVTLDNAHIDGMNVESNSAMIYVPSSGNLTIAGDTVIENGKNSGNGGAISVSQGSLTVEGGTITKNTAKQGGGIYAYGGELVSFEGGIISENKATGGNGGGGAYIGATSSEFGVNGGRTLFDANESTQLGGGVFLVNGTNANTHHYIYKATFTNNKSYRSMQYFDGGAIYIQSGTTAHMKNVYVSGNTDSDKANNGYTAVAVCPTGKLAIYELEGLLAVNNGKNPDIGVIAGGQVTSTAPKVYLPSNAPGGGEVSYRYSDGTVVDTSDYQFIEGYFRLFTKASDSAIDAARATAEADGVIITGNYATQYGAGIMTNGLLKIGTETKSLKVVKVWDDGNENHENDQILVYLTKDGKIVDQDFRSDSSVVLNKDNNWSYTWTNLGNQFEWSVKEASVGGYKSNVEVTKDTEFSAIADKYYIATITNTKDDEPSNKLVITKNAYGLDANASYNFTLKLDNVGNGAYAINVNGTLKPIYNNEITFSLKHGQSAVVEGLPEGFTYKVTEEKNEAAYNTYTAESVTANQGGAGSIYSVNVVNVSKVDITVEKQWADKDDGAIRPKEIKVDLLANGEKIDTVTISADAEGKWLGSFKDLPEYDAEGEKIVYTVKEQDVSGYTSKVDGLLITNTLQRGSLTIEKKVVGGSDAAKTEIEYKFTVTGPYDYSKEVIIKGEGKEALIGLIPGEYTVTENEEEAKIEGYNLTVTGNGVTANVVAGEESSEITVTNTYTPPETPGGGPTYVSRTVNKVWVGDGDIERPASVTVQLYQNGSVYETVTLSAANGWSFTWNRLNDSYTWTIGEINVPEGYTSTVSQDGSVVTITNTYEEPEIPDEPPPLTDIPDEDPPQAEPPKGPEEEIPDEDVPLSDVPETGDNSTKWFGAALMSAFGLAILSLFDRKKRKEG